MRLLREIAEMEERRILFEGIDTPDIDRWPVYCKHGGGQGLLRARSLSPENVIKEIQSARLRGRGGAWRLVGDRWQQAQAEGGADYVVVDLLEPDPGRFRDRKLAERHPHRLLEGARIAAHAVGATSIFLCIDAESLRARQALQQAIVATQEQATTIQLHPARGPFPLAAGSSLAVELLRGGRAEPQADDGVAGLDRLFAGSAIVHSASTLGYLPALLATAGDVFQTVGSEWAPGTQAFCVSGLVRRPGLYEVELGRGTVRDLIEGIAGGARPERAIKFVLHAGYGSSPVLTAGDLDRPLDPGLWADPAGGPLSGVFGGGAVIVADDSVCPVDTARRLAQAYAGAACGKCLPCREGTAWLAAALSRLEAGTAQANDLAWIIQRCNHLTPAVALCGHAPSAARSIRALHDAFPEEFAAHLDGGCAVAKDLSMKVPDSIHMRY
ncbi:MAG: SLBB domain-containing protein [bacterium]|nr:SLBB domain-containing protein [bacterium]